VAETRSWNWRIWIGFTVAVFAAVSYVPIFARFAVTRDLPWANFLLFIVAGVLLASGVRRAFRQPESYRGKVFGSVASGVGFLLFALFCVGTYFAARSLPPGSSALKVGQRAPDFRLTNADGAQVTLSELRQQGAVLLIFYRGYW
jgi:hypothetical protein